MVVTEKLVLEPIFGTKVSITANSSPHAVMLGCVGWLGTPSEDKEVQFISSHRQTGNCLNVIQNARIV